jgi:hypothetical protein
MLNRILHSPFSILHSPFLARFKPLVGRIPVLGPWLTRVYQQQKLQQNCDYHEWIQRRVRQRDEDYSTPTSSAPTFDILTLTYETDPQVLRKTAASVFAQDFPHWRWVIVDNSSTRPETLAVLDELSRHPQVVVQRFAENHGITEGHRLGLAMCSAEYVALLDHDDLLSPDALRICAWYVDRHDRPDFLYSDEDKCDMRDRHFYPFFKPDFSPALLLDTGYTCHLSVVRREKLIECGAFTEREVEGTQDWDMAVRLYEIGARVVHIPEILYSWRATRTSTAASASAKSYVGDAHRQCLTRYLARRGLSDRFETQANPLFPVPAIGLWRFRRLAEATGPLVDVILVANENAREMAAAIASCLRETDYPNFRLRVIVPHGEQNIEALRASCRELLPKLPDHVTFESNAPGPINFPDTINRTLRQPAADQAVADFIAFLPTGSRLLYRDWLWEAVGQFELHPQAAFVGGRLFGGDHQVIGGSAIFGLMGATGIAYENAARSEKGYFCFNACHRNVSAIVGSPWVAHRGRVLQLGGFDAQYPVAFFEADFAARCHKAGWYAIASPYIAAIGSKRPDFDAHVNEEWPALYREHCDLLRDDPFYSPYLGFHPSTIYQIVEPEERGNYVNSRLLHLQAGSNDVERYRGLPSGRYLVSRNCESPLTLNASHQRGAGIFVETSVRLPQTRYGIPLPAGSRDMTSSDEQEVTLTSAWKTEDQAA